MYLKKKMPLMKVKISEESVGQDVTSMMTFYIVTGPTIIFDIRRLLKSTQQRQVST